jgi:excisionase family DNA binding protein
MAARDTTDEHADAAVMTVDELAAYIRIHRSTVYRLAKAGKIPHFRMGSAYRFRREEVDLWMKNQR